MQDSVPDWAGELDKVEGQVVASRFSARLGDIDKAYRHTHRKAQLMYCTSGALTCEVDNGMWIVPAQTAVWIPGGLPHKAFGSGDIACCSLLIEPDAHPALPVKCSTFAVSGLLRELIFEAVNFAPSSIERPRDAHVTALILEEIAAATPENLALPMPDDARLIRFVKHMLEHPDDGRSQEEWASHLGTSERGLRRLFQDQLGMSFSQWRHQLHVILAIRRMILGDSVQTISIDLGYENASSFITMFKKTMGKPPARFLTEYKFAPPPNSE